MDLDDGKTEEWEDSVSIIEVDPRDDAKLWTQGYDAFGRGQTQNANPYDAVEDGHRHHEWYNGWMEAAIETQEGMTDE